MTESPANLDQLKSEALTALQAATTAAELEQWRITYLGRKGKVPALMRTLKALPADQKKEQGQKANQIKQELTDQYQAKKKSYLSDEKPPSHEIKLGSPSEAAPSGGAKLGHLHPLTAALRRARSIFAAMGFTIVEGPDVEEAKYNFDQLNIPFEHPARAETDTFYLRNLPDLVLRTHVSPLQVRGVIEHDLKPPFKMMYYGPSFRSEKEDPTHLSVFQQYEIMVVSETVSLADLRAIMQTFYSLFFGQEFEFRFRPAYYPFVEPGIDIDMRDKVTGKGDWLEMAGAGMVHPNVLRNINVDPDKYQGIALGGGLDRLAMLKHNIPDARLFYSGDMRFLTQF